MDPKEAARVSAEAAAIVLRLMTKTDKGNRLFPQVELLAAFAAHLDPKEAARVSAEAARKLAQAMNKVTDPTDIWFRARLVEDSGSPGAQGCCSSHGHYHPNNRQDHQFPGHSISGIWLIGSGARPGPQETSKAAATLTQALTQPLMTLPINNDVGWNMRHDLSVVAARLEPEEAGRVADMIAQAMSIMNNHGGLWDLTQFLKVLATRLEPKKATEVATSLTQAMAKTNDPRTRQYMAEGLHAVMARLDPQAAAHVSAEAVGRLTQTMTKTTNSQDLWSLRQGIFALADFLEPKEAALAAVTLMQVMNQTTDPQALSPLAWSMSALAHRLEPKVAAQVAATLGGPFPKRTIPCSPVSGAKLVGGGGWFGPQEAAHVSAEGAAAYPSPEQDE